MKSNGLVEICRRLASAARRIAMYLTDQHKSVRGVSFKDGSLKRGHRGQAAASRVPHSA